jgi:hypothetical protein
MRVLSGMNTILVVRMLRPGKSVELHLRIPKPLINILGLGEPLAQVFERPFDAERATNATMVVLKNTGYGVLERPKETTEALVKFL